MHSQLDMINQLEALKLLEESDIPLTAGKPAETSSGVKVMMGVDVPWAKATAESPKEVAIPKGIPNQATRDTSV